MRNLNSSVALVAETPLGGSAVSAVRNFWIYSSEQFCSDLVCGISIQKSSLRSRKSGYFAQQIDECSEVLPNAA